METSLSKESLSAISDAIVASISKQPQNEKEKQTKFEEKDRLNPVQSKTTAGQVGKFFSRAYNWLNRAPNRILNVLFSGPQTSLHYLIYSLFAALWNKEYKEV